MLVPFFRSAVTSLLSKKNDAGVPACLLLSSGKGVALVYLTAPASVLRLWLVVCG